MWLEALHGLLKIATFMFSLRPNLQFLQFLVHGCRLKTLCVKWHICVCYTLVCKAQMLHWQIIDCPRKAMCHTYDSHLGEYINLLCDGKRTKLFTKSSQCSDIVTVAFAEIYWFWAGRNRSQSHPFFFHFHSNILLFPLFYLVGKCQRESIQLNPLKSKVSQ